MSDRTTDLHARLISQQSTDELERKAIKARQRGIWTQEDMDYADRCAAELVEAIRWE